MATHHFLYDSFKTNLKKMSCTLTTKGKSENPNESLNNVIWSLCPKRLFVILRTLKFGVSEAVGLLSFHDIHLSKIKINRTDGNASRK